MFRLPNNAVQKALIEKLRTKLTDLNIYDYVPFDAVLPYITIGNMVTTDISEKNLNQYKLILQINIWSEYSGKYQVNFIAQRIINLLSSPDTAYLDLSKEKFVLRQIAVNMYEAYPENEDGYNGVIETEFIIQDESEE